MAAAAQDLYPFDESTEWSSIANGSTLKILKGDAKGVFTGTIKSDDGHAYPTGNFEVHGRFHPTPSGPMNEISFHAMWAKDDDPTFTISMTAWSGTMKLTADGPIIETTWSRHRMRTQGEDTFKLLRHGIAD